MLNTAVSKVGTLAVGIALARILGPGEFGSFAVAMVALLAVLSFNELGVSLAIVRWKGDPRPIVPTVATISIVSSAALFAACYVAAPTYAAAMGSPESTSVVRVLLASILINGVVAAPAAVLQREFKQKEKMVADQANAWLGAGISIALALTGMGAMSLAIGRLVGSTVSAVIFGIYAPSALKPGLDSSLLRPLLSFGLPLAGASAVVFAAGYVDQVVTGALLGPTELGFYVLAFNLASWPVSVFSQPLRAVAPAAFARMQSDLQGMSSNFRRVLGILASVAFPVCFVLAGTAVPLVSFVYGEQWLPAASALTWLALLAGCRIVFELTYDYLVVLRKTKGILVIQVTWLVALVPSAVVGASARGIAGVAAAQVAVAVIVVLPMYLRQIRDTGLPAYQALSRLSGPLAAGLFVWPVTHIIGDQMTNEWLAVALSSMAGLVGIAILLACEPGLIRRLRSQIDRRGNGQVAS
ncbi:oligosaccharide flippase family protein [Ornithinicoccus hortensis]|uniref:oligosaccharide flippase family protein n=1 Tax=Ornithinicoccus hortensis TaxID=82346 RepID=UPI0014783F0B|nr:oligosaccharide flippase family protein [Ornithinicoccus hortensis]